MQRPGAATRLAITDLPTTVKSHSRPHTLQTSLVERQTPGEATLPVVGLLKVAADPVQQVFELHLTQQGPQLLDGHLLGGGVDQLLSQRAAGRGERLLSHKHHLH